MTRLRTRARFSILGGGASLVLAAYLLVYHPATVELEDTRVLLDAKTAAARNEAARAQEVATLEQSLTRDRSLLDRVTSLLRGTPDPYSAFDRFASDLRRRGCPDPEFDRAASESEVVSLESGETLRLEHFRVRFECGFRDCVELLDAWQDDESALRFQTLDVHPSAADPDRVAVELVCAVPRFEPAAPAEKGAPP